MRVIDQLKSLTKDSFVYGLSSVIGKFISFFLIPLYTAYISPHEFGIYGLINNSFVFLNILLVFALDNSTARWIYDTEDKEDKKRTVNTWLWFYLSLSFCVTLLFFFFRAQFATVILKDKSSGFLLLIMMLALPFNCFVTVASNVLRFIRKPKALLLITFSQSFLLIVLNIVSVKYLHLGLKGIFTGVLISYIFSSIISIILIKKWISWPPKLDWYRLQKMLTYSWPFVPAGISIWLVNVSGAFFINYFMNQQEAGLFQLGSSFASVLAVVVAAFQQAWPPFAFSIMKNENAKQTYASVLYVFTCIMCCLCVGISLFAKEILHLLVTPAYYNADSVITILAYNYLFAGLLSIADLGPSIVKNTKPLGGVMVFSAILIVVFNCILIPLLGKDGAALATCLAQAIAVIILFYFSQKLFYIPYNFKAVSLIIGISIALWLVGRTIKFHSIFIEITSKLFLLLVLCFVILFQQKKKIEALVSKLFVKKKYV